MEKTLKEERSFYIVIASQRIGAKRRPMTGYAKQSRKAWIASSLCSSQ
jgi:hypothetical protein